MLNSALLKQIIKTWQSRSTTVPKLWHQQGSPDVPNLPNQDTIQFMWIYLLISHQAPQTLKTFQGPEPNWQLFRLGPCLGTKWCTPRTVLFLPRIYLVLCARSEGHSWGHRQCLASCVPLMRSIFSFLAQALQVLQKLCFYLAVHCKTKQNKTKNHPIDSHFQIKLKFKTRAARVDQTSQATF